MTDLPPIETSEALFETLKRELGYCPCAYEDALPVLRELLRRVAARSDLVKDEAAFRQASAEFERYLFAQSSSGVASWMIYTLDRADLLYHGWNVMDVWITRKGRWLLAGLERFAEA